MKGRAKAFKYIYTYMDMESVYADIAKLLEVWRGKTLNSQVCNLS